MANEITVTTFDNASFLALAAKLPYGQWVRPSRVNKDGKSVKAGSSGIFGNDIEMRLGVPINNLKTADFGEGLTRYEIKSKCNSVKTLHTLLNRNPTFWDDPFAPKRKKGKKGANPRLVERFGVPISRDDPDPERFDKYSRSLHMTWGVNDTDREVNGEFGKYIFNITSDDDYTRINVFERDRIGTAIFFAAWENKSLFADVENKIGGNLGCFHYDVRGEKGEEEYCLTSFSRYSGFSQTSFVNALKSGNLKIDLALSKYRNKNGARDHGTGFRISETDLPKLYASSKVIFSA